MQLSSIMFNIKYFKSIVKGNLPRKERRCAVSYSHESQRITLTCYLVKEASIVAVMHNGQSIKSNRILEESCALLF